jgi:RNA polymerase sigma-70 factor (ECF subfamily)
MTQSFSEQLIAMLPRLRRFARSLTGSADKADELVQTACAKALAAKESWAPGTRFDSWMFRIARNAWIDTIRRSRHEAVTAGEGEIEQVAGTDGEDAQVARLTLNTVMAAIDRLPDDQREVLVLVVMEEFSYGEVADMLGIPIGTVMSRLARARVKIAAATGIDRTGKR